MVKKPDTPSAPLPVDMTRRAIPKLNRHAKFVHRDVLKRGHPSRSFRMTGALRKTLPTPRLPIDWTKKDSLPFSMYGNDTEGDCMYAAALHADGTWTGNTGTESVFDLPIILKEYESLSGGDNGLSEGDLLGGWYQGLCRNPLVNIEDALDIDPLDTNLCQAVLQEFGCIIFMLSVPDQWIDNFDTDYVWDAGSGISANPNNGHGTLWNGADTHSRFKVQTWGSHGWITEAGIKVCDPSAFAVFSKRWFNAQGVAPNGRKYQDAASLWVSAGGRNPSPFSPTPGPGPTPTPVSHTLFDFQVNRPIKAGQRILLPVPVDMKDGVYGVSLVHGLEEAESGATVESVY